MAVFFAKKRCFAALPWPQNARFVTVITVVIYPVVTSFSLVMVTESAS